MALSLDSYCSTWIENSILKWTSPELCPPGPSSYLPTWNFPSSQEMEPFFFPAAQDTAIAGVLVTFPQNHKFDPSANPVGSPFHILRFARADQVWASGPLLFLVPSSSDSSPGYLLGDTPLSFRSPFTCHFRGRLSPTTLCKGAHLFILNLLTLLHFLLNVLST